MVSRAAARERGGGGRDGAGSSGDRRWREGEGKGCRALRRKMFTYSHVHLFTEWWLFIPSVKQ